MGWLTLEEFREGCRELLGGLLRDQGFEEVGAYSRPKGYAVEFARGDDRVFIDEEGDVIDCDVTLETGPDRFYRVDLVQMLGSRGVRSLMKYEGWRDGLTVLAAELEPYAAEVFSLDAEAMDSRYCFPVTRAQAKRYFEIQRGT